MTEDQQLRKYAISFFCNKGVEYNEEMVQLKIGQLKLKRAIRKREKELCQ
jgi:hypothetical protein